MALLGRGKAGLERAAADALAAGGRGLHLQEDTSRHEGVFRAARYIEETLDPVDVWVNDAELFFYAKDEYTATQAIRVMGQIQELDVRWL